MTVSEAIEKSQNNNWRSPIMTFASTCPLVMLDVRVVRWTV